MSAYERQRRRRNARRRIAAYLDPTVPRFRSRKAELQAAVLELKRDDEYGARSIAAMPNRYYGGTGTIHGTGEVNIETYCGEVVSVWFRCQHLPFTVSEVSTRRAEEMGLAYDSQPPPSIVGVEMEPW